jgi:hypothetical protein
MRPEEHPPQPNLSHQARVLQFVFWIGPEGPSTTLPCKSENDCPGYPTDDCRNAGGPESSTL